MTGSDLERVRAVLAPLPDAGGGAAVVLATSGVPPAVALLSTGDVAINGAVARAVTYGGSSVATRLGTAFTLVVPAGDVTFRVEVVDATSRAAGKLAVIEGTIDGVRPTAEPPWMLDLRFRPDPDAGPTEVEPFLAYWAAVRGWLRAGATGDPPVPAI